MDEKKPVEVALRELVKRMYEECFGAYGGNYEGQMEREIQALIAAIHNLGQPGQLPGRPFEE